jgi:dTDP-4-amino-4,6-dideoxygalactose transaminase
MTRRWATTCWATIPPSSDWRSWPRGRLGKEAALFVPSGTMGNLVSLLAHCGRGDEVILGDQAHIYLYEAGGSAAVGSIHPRPLPNRPDGRIDLAAVEAAIRPKRRACAAQQAAGAGKHPQPLQRRGAAGSLHGRGQRAGAWPRG